MEEIIDEEFFWRKFWFCFVVPVSFLDTVSFYQMQDNACTSFLEVMLIKNLFFLFMVLFTMFFMMFPFPYLLDDTFSRKTLSNNKDHI